LSFLALTIEHNDDDDGGDDESNDNGSSESSYRDDREGRSEIALDSGQPRFVIQNVF
jgi:hypothetical protein